MPLRTRVTELLGIEHPIIQGGMHYVGYAVLAAAVSNAGGLGVITALTQKTPDALREEIRKCKQLTSKPFGVNVTLLPMLAPPDYGAYAQVIVDEKVPVVETAGRNPEKMIKFFSAHGIKVIHKCVTVRHALSAERMGAHAISLDGYECGGHPGEVECGNFVLQAVGARQLKVPFVCSGGVANGAQLAAALALGADGVNCGTRFMATKEAPIHDGIKQALVKAGEYDTTHVMRTLKNTERAFKNTVTDEVLKIEKEHPGDFSKIAHLVKGDNYRKAFQETGDPTKSVWSCGQSIALIDDIPTCQELIAKMVADAEGIIKGRLAGMMTAKL